MRMLLLSLLFWAIAVPAQALSLFSAAETVTATDGIVSLDASGLKPEAARHYRYKADDTVIRLFVVRDRQGTLRAALDACEVCWREDEGYVLRDGAMICKNCGRRFALNRIGQVRGGCNPHPLAFERDGDILRVPLDEILEGTRYFPGGKR